MERWIAPQEEPRPRHAPPPPPPVAFGRRHRPPHEIMFEGMEYLSAQVQRLEAEVIRLRELVEQRSRG
jgi:hypothetical protein